MALPKANYTQIPNVIFDKIPDLSESELRLIAVISRQSFGWHKDAVRISQTELEKLTGLSIRGVQYGVQKLIVRGWLKRYKEPNFSTYEIDVEDDSNPCNDCTPSSNKPPQPVQGYPSNQCRGTPATSAGVGGGTIIRERKERNIKESTSRASASSAGDHFHQELISKWCEGYQKHFSRAYKFMGGRDGKAAKELIKTGLTPDGIMLVAEKAWRNQVGFFCKSAVTLHGLNDRWNEIQAELDNSKSNGNGCSKAIAGLLDYNGELLWHLRTSRSVGIGQPPKQS
jgi:phage replication O-like protein O